MILIVLKLMLTMVFVCINLIDLIKLFVLWTEQFILTISEKMLITIRVYVYKSSLNTVRPLSFMIKL